MKWSAYPEHTNVVERTERRSVRLDHAEHAMELPADKEDNKEVVGIPEPLEVSTAPLFPREENHDTQSQCHNPTGKTRTGCKVGSEEGDNFFAWGRGSRVGCRKPGKVNHMRSDMHNATDYDGPCSRFVEGDVLVERDEVVQGSATQQ